MLRVKAVMTKGLVSENRKTLRNVLLQQVFSFDQQLFYLDRCREVELLPVKVSPLPDD